MRLLKEHATFTFTLLAFFLLVALVNPLRETSVGDDWTYAHTVKTLLETGHYQLHQSSMANIPFQAYWGAAFCKVLGYSFVSLKISTLTLLFLSLFAFYGLAREHGLDRNAAGLIPLAYMAGPLIPRFAFSFYSEIPFLSCIIIALFLYTRALRLQSFGWMFAASLAASCAILTRQFGAAFVPGLFLAWVWRRETRRQMPLFVIGMVLPLLATIWQIYMGMAHPTLGNKDAMDQTAAFLKLSNIGNLMLESLWRVSVIWQYMVFLYLPLVCIGLVVFVRDNGANNPVSLKWIHRIGLTLLGLIAVLLSPLVSDFCFGDKWGGFLDGRTRWRLLAIALIALVLASAAFYFTRKKDATQEIPVQEKQNKAGWVLLLGITIFCGYFLYYHYRRGGNLFWPYLPWSLSDLLRRWGLKVPVPLSIVTFFGSILFGRMVILRYWREWRALPVEQQFLDFASLFFLGILFIFPTMGDRYLITMLPVSAIILGRRLGPWLSQRRVAATLTISFMLFLSGGWIRGEQSAEASTWTAGEWLRGIGIPTQNIFNDGNAAWVCYYRIAEYNQEQIEKNAKIDFWYDWYPREEKKARYMVNWSIPRDEASSITMLCTLPYTHRFYDILDVFFGDDDPVLKARKITARDLFFNQRVIYVYRRNATPPPIESPK